MEYKISHNKQEISYSQKDETVFLNDQPVSQVFKWIKQGELAYLNVNNKTYRVTVIKFDKENKTVKLKINGHIMELSISDPLDLLLKNLGLDKLMNKGVADVKAPMPGLVLNIIAKAGDEVKKGDPLLILEAMKMENIIKSPIDGIIKAIHVEEKQAIDKNKLMVEFEKQATH